MATAKKRDIFGRELLEIEKLKSNIRKYIDQFHSGDWSVSLEITKTGVKNQQTIRISLGVKFSDGSERTVVFDSMLSISQKRSPRKIVYTPLFFDFGKRLDVNRVPKKFTSTEIASSEIMLSLCTWLDDRALYLDTFFEK